MSLGDLVTPLNVGLAIAVFAAVGTAMLIRHHGGFWRAAWGGERREVGRVRLTLGEPGVHCELTVYIVTLRQGAPYVAIGATSESPISRAFSYARYSSTDALELGRLFVEASERARA